MQPLHENVILFCMHTSDNLGLSSERRKRREKMFPQYKQNLIKQELFFIYIYIYNMYICNR